MKNQRITKLLSLRQSNVAIKKIHSFGLGVINGWIDSSGDMARALRQANVAKVVIILVPEQEEPLRFSMYQIVEFRKTAMNTSGSELLAMPKITAIMMKSTTDLMIQRRVLRGIPSCRKVKRLSRKISKKRISSTFIGDG